MTTATDLTDPAVKAAIAAAVKEAVETETSGLKAKNAELLADLKEARKGKQIDPAEVEKLEARIETLTGELSTAQKQAKDATTAAEKATKALEAESSVTHRLVAENGLMSALSKAGVTDPAYLEAVKALHLGSVKVVADGDTRKAMYGDKDVEAAITEWAGTDVGKKFVAAPVNGGGGASGGGGKGGSGKEMGRNDFAALAPRAQSDFVKDGGKVIDQAA